MERCPEHLVDGVMSRYKGCKTAASIDGELPSSFAYEKISDGCLHGVTKIDQMQYGFMPGRGTVDAVFVLRRLY